MAGVLSDIQQIYEWIVYFKDIYDTIEGNTDRCHLLMNRCSSFKEYLEKVDKKRLNSDKSLVNGIQLLSQTVGKCVAFVNKHGKAGWKQFFKNAAYPKSIESDFVELNQQLTQASNDLHFGLTVHLCDIEKASNADDGVLSQVLVELMETHGEISEIATGQCDIKTALDEVRALILSQSAALFALMHQQSLEDETPKNTSIKSEATTPSLPPSSSSTPTPSVSIASKKAINSSEDDIDGVDMSVLEWDKTNPKNILGKGSFATVFKCDYDGVLCALKLFENLNMLSYKALKSVKREARIMNMASHANIIAFRGFDVESGIIVCELAECSLHDVLHRNELRHRIELKLNWLFGIASALRFLHYHKIIHRDIKPQNILMVRQNGVMVAKVADFGISTTVGMSTAGSTAGSKSAAGSVSYMAPELIIFDGDAPVYTTAVDVYSFGVLANEVLSEEEPWSGMKLPQIYGAITQGKRPKLFVASSSSPLEQGLLEMIGSASSGCLSSDKDERWTSVKAAKELQSLRRRFASDASDGSDSPLKATSVVATTKLPALQSATAVSVTEVISEVIESRHEQKVGSKESTPTSKNNASKADSTQLLVSTPNTYSVTSLGNPSIPPPPPRNNDSNVYSAASPSKASTASTANTHVLPSTAPIPSKSIPSVSNFMLSFSVLILLLSGINS